MYLSGSTEVRNSLIIGLPFFFQLVFALLLSLFLLYFPFFLFSGISSLIFFFPRHPLRIRGKGLLYSAFLLLFFSLSSAAPAGTLSHHFSTVAAKTNGALSRCPLRLFTAPLETMESRISKRCEHPRASSRPLWYLFSYFSLLYAHVFFCKIYALWREATRNASIFSCQKMDVSLLFFP